MHACSIQGFTIPCVWVSTHFAQDVCWARVLQLNFTSVPVHESGTEATLQEPADTTAETAWNAVMSSLINHK